MTRSQMRTQLKIDLRALGFSEWSDDELNSLLNTAYALVQKEIVKVNANWHVAFDTTPTEIGESWYPMPPTFGIKRIGFRATSGGTKVYMKKKNLEDIETLVPGDTYYYAREGTWIGIFPPPTAVVSNGIEWQHCPIYALDDDDEVPKIKTPLHICIVWWAKILAVGDDHEDTAKTQAKIGQVMGDLSQWYDVMMDGPERLSIEV